MISLVALALTAVSLAGSPQRAVEPKAVVSPAAPAQSPAAESRAAPAQRAAAPEAVVSPAAPAERAAAPEAAERRPPYSATISPIGPELRKRMTSWRPGCPVHVRDLRLLRVTRWGFDRRAHRGRLIVHEDHARPIRWVMRVLYRRKYPIRRMRLVDAYGSDDRRSMAADNTSAFNCRFVAGTSRWSMHAYGLAIDLNPVENPYVSGGHVSPPAGRRYADRSTRAPGVIHRGGFVVRAFRRIGWEWAGNWPGTKDYQHFSSTGS